MGQDLKHEIEFFDRFGVGEAEYDALGEHAYARLLELFARHVRPLRGERCIDLGCGTGAFTRRLHAFGLELLGVDISPACVARANATAAGERYIVGDITGTGLPGGEWDIAVYSGVLHHFNASAGRVATLREGARLLRPGGRAFAFDPSAGSPTMRLYRDPRSPLFSRAGKTENEVLLDPAQLRREIEAASLRPVLVEGTGGMTFRYIEGRIARLALPLYNLYELALGATPLQRRFGTFVVTVAEKPAP